jgi:hypothetical protein
MSGQLPAGSDMHASTTLRVYAHALQERDQAAAEVLGELLFKELPSFQTAPDSGRGCWLPR